ncbi:MAG: methyltransferase domain-containing protein [Methanomassiliicoccales archaeon]
MRAREEHRDGGETRMNAECKLIIKEWEEVRQRIPHIAAKVQPEAMSAYWGRASRRYEDCVFGQDVEGRTVELLRREGHLRPGDRVLDIGCGPGTHALLFAETADEVVCLDYSKDMLERLQNKAASAGVKNITPLHGTWEDFSTRKRFDLVFSSFCPATNDWRSLLRMESLSRRSCCLVASAKPLRDSLQFRILDAIGPNSFSNQGYDIMYPLRFLHSLGRCPSLWTFMTYVEVKRTREEIIEGQLDYLSLLMPVGERERSIVEREVERAPWINGSLREPRRVGVLFWERVEENGSDCRGVRK